jgi:probable rRNA maturation factor
MKKNSRNGRPARNGKPRRVVSVRRERNLPPRKAPAALIRRAVRRTLERQAFRKDCSVAVILAGEETLARLNARFRGVERPTDVLSFPSKAVDPETGLLHLGDVVISLPRAARQAAAHGKTLTSEILLLAVHGTLHLLGHDHERASEKRRMWRAQREILKELAEKP